jgi:transposase
MATATVQIDRAELTELRLQAHYWRTQHRRAVEREMALKARVREVQGLLREERAANAALRRRVSDLEAQLDDVAAERDRQIEALKAKLVWLQQQMFGRKTEQTKERSAEAEADACGTDTAEGTPGPRDTPKRRRGQQPGAEGHGRKRREGLPTEVISHDLASDKRCCPRCGQPFAEFPGTEDSEEIHWEVRLVRRVHRRKRYRPTCACGAGAGFVAAPCPPKLIPKGMFSVGFWTELLLEKWLHQRPLHRVLKVLRLKNLPISQGTITGGLRRIGELLQPVYARLLERSRSATRWKMDETRWMVFVEVEGKTGYRWWLWVVITDDTVVYLLEPTRSAQVPRDHLGEEAEGMVLADRYKVYQALGAKILVAYCWSHVRRDYVRIHDSREVLRPWADEWVQRINELFALNQDRVAWPVGSEEFAAKDQAVREALEAMASVRDRELTDPDLHEAAREALESQQNHWDGLTLFVDHPEIPMDNNESERRLRDPAMGRKNYFGCGSLWTGMLTAILFSLFHTLLKNHINPEAWLLAYLQACAENGGQPLEAEAVDGFLPWNLSEEQKTAWHYPEHPP